MTFIKVYVLLEFYVSSYCPLFLLSNFTEPTTSDTPDVAFNNTKRYNVSLLRALHKCFWFQFYSVGILKLVADCAGFAGPLLLNKLVGFIENGSEEMSYGYAYATGLFVTTIIGKL